MFGDELDPVQVRRPAAQQARRVLVRCEAAVDEREPRTAARVLERPGHDGVGLAGRANTALNFITFTTAFAVQYLIGAIIDLWPATPAGGYPPQAYQAAFALFLGLQLVALIWYLLRAPDQRETAAIAEKGLPS